MYINLPLLNSVEALQGRDGDKDDNSLLAVANFDLFQDPKSACELQDITLDRFPSCSKKSIVRWLRRASFPREKRERSIKREFFRNVYFKIPFLSCRNSRRAIRFSGDARRRAIV